MIIRAAVLRDGRWVWRATSRHERGSAHMVSYQPADVVEPDWERVDGLWLPTTAIARPLIGFHN